MANAASKEVLHLVVASTGIYNLQNFDFDSPNQA